MTRLNKKELKFKSLLKIEARILEVHSILRNSPKILVEPFQRGWITFIDVRDDIKRRENYPYIKEIIELSFSRYVTKDVKYIKLIRSLKSYEKVMTSYRKVYRYGIDYPILIPEKKYNNLCTQSKKFLEEDIGSSAYSLFKGKYYRVKIPHYYLVLKVKPNIITYIREDDPILLGELEFLRKKVRELYGYSIYRKTRPSNDIRVRARSEISKFLKGINEDINIEKSKQDYYY